MSSDRKLTNDAIEWSSELMGDHGQELLLGLHADLQILNLLQSAQPHQQDWHSDAREKVLAQVNLPVPFKTLP